jgi:hypothetical protein
METPAEYQSRKRLPTAVRRYRRLRGLLCHGPGQLVDNKPESEPTVDGLMLALGHPVDKENKKSESK